MNARVFLHPQHAPKQAHAYPTSMWSHEVSVPTLCPYLIKRLCIGPYEVKIFHHLSMPLVATVPQPPPHGALRRSRPRRQQFAERHPRRVHAQVSIPSSNPITEDATHFESLAMTGGRTEQYFNSDRIRPPSISRDPNSRGDFQPIDSRIGQARTTT